MIKKILKIYPYKQGAQPLLGKNLKLNTNENCYNSNIIVIKNILKELKFFGNILKFYPDPDSISIKLEICKYYNLFLKNIFIGNGSDDVLSNIFLTFFRNKKLYLFDLTYSFYESFIKLYKINYKIVKLNKNFSINIKSFKNNNNNIIINNPNSPTGKSLKLLKLKFLLNKTNSLLVLDETYSEFNNYSFIDINYIEKYNLIINKTFSKYSALAGLRIGFALSKNLIINKMNIVKNSLNSYPLTIISQLSIKNIYKNSLHFYKIKNKINKSKLFLLNKLVKKNFKIFNSFSNFLLITNKNLNINKLLKYLNKKNILVRKFELPRIENYLRVSIGKKKEFLILIESIKIFMKF